MSTLPDESRRHLELEATRAERRLLETLGEVEHRAHHVKDEVARLPRRLAVPLLAVATVLGVVATVLVARRWIGRRS